MVEAPGVEPGSEDRQRRVSTCVAADLGFRFRPRPAAGLERLLAQCVSPVAAEHRRRTSPLSSPHPPAGLRGGTVLLYLAASASLWVAGVVSRLLPGPGARHAT